MPDMSEECMACITEAEGLVPRSEHNLNSVYCRKAREMAGAIMSKEGQVVERLGNAEVDPFRQQLAESADAASSKAEASLGTELKELAQEVERVESQSSDDALADTIHGRVARADKPRPKKSPSMQERFKQRVNDEMGLRIGIDRAEMPFNGRDAEALAFRALLDVGMYHERMAQERKDMIELLRQIANSNHGDEVVVYCIERARTMLDGMGIER